MQEHALFLCYNDIFNFKEFYMAITHPVLLCAKEDYKPHIVKVNDVAIKALNIDLTVAQEDVSCQHEFLKDWKLEDALHYIFALNSINFKFWDLTPKFVRYQNGGKFGALAANEGFHKLYLKLQEVNFKDFEDLLTEDLMYECYGDIPNVEARIEILKESLNPSQKLLLRALCAKAFKSDVVSFELVEKIIDFMPKSFGDPYMKKVQLAVYEAIAYWNMVKGTKIALEELTVAADYQLPKVLEGMGVIVYSEALKKTIANHGLIKSDSEEELAIRSATIVACEKIRRFFNVSVPALDRFLWLKRNDFDTNFHLTDTTDY